MKFKMPHTLVLRFILPFMVKIFIISSIVLILAVILGYN
jgi:hypothetical protein